ncbi:MAG: O-antigen ligase family protein [Solirubrobacteraceae bacterium]
MIGVTIVAALAAVYSSYRISVTPPSVHARTVQFSAAFAQVEVDTPVSELIDRRQDMYLPLTKNVAVTEALYLQSAGVTQAAARAAGIPGQKVEASGPFTLLLNLNKPAAVGPPLPPDPRVNPNYRLLVDVNGAQPMISIYAQAPTTEAAVAMVNTARRVLFQHVAEVEKGFHVPREVRVVLRPLGPAVGGVVEPGATTKLMLLAFIVVFVLGLAMMHWLEHRKANKARIASELAELDPIEDAPAHSDDWPHTTRILPWLVAIFLATIFLVPIDAMSVPLHLGAEGNPDRVLLLLTLGLWIPVLLIGSRKVRPRVRFTRIHLWVLVFLGLCFLSVALNGNTLAIYTEVSPTVKKLLLMVSFVMFFVLASSIIRPREVPKLVGFMVILGVIVAVATIIESKTRYNPFYSLWEKVAPVKLPLEIDQLDDIGRLTVDGPTSEPLELAALLAVVFPFAVVGALDAKTRASRWRYIIASTILLAGALATARKTSVVAPGIGLLVLMAYRPRQMLRAAAISIVPLFIAVHLISPGQIGSVVTELLPGHINTVSTTTVRTARYDAVRPDILSHLWLGRGFQSYDPMKYRVLDNEYLGLLIGVGIVGTLIYLAIFGSMLRVAHPMVRAPDPARARFALPAVAGIVVVLVSNALFDVLSFPHVSYLFFFLGAMLVAARGRSPDAPSVPARARTHRRLQPRAPVRVLEHATSSGVRQLDRPGATVSR